jgi:uncharacterized repeat protein (TIGR02543 family)
VHLVETTEPPPLPVPRVAQVLVHVHGNGTVTSRLRSLQGAGAEVQQIRCGMRGTACYAQTDPSQRVQMAASPGAGYRFAGWTGACSGSGPVCTVQATAATTVSAQFVPSGRRIVALRLGPPRLTAKWSASVGKGTLIVRGSVGAPARARLEVRRPGGGPLLFKRLRLRGGKFTIRRPLQRGRLLRGATLLPGGFVVVMRGRSGLFPLPLQIRTLTLNSPAEGVVRTAWISPSRTGARVQRLPSGSTEAWATFQFFARPRLQPLFVRWFGRTGEALGTKEKNSRGTIKTGIGASPIPSGNYRVELVAGSRVVRRLNVRVG